MAPEGGSKNDWKNHKNRPVKNKHIIQEILILQNDIPKVSLKHVKAHQTDDEDLHSYGNNMADKLAVKGRELYY